MSFLVIPQPYSPNETRLQFQNSIYHTNPASPFAPSPKFLQNLTAQREEVCGILLSSTLDLNNYTTTTTTTKRNNCDDVNFDTFQNHMKNKLLPIMDTYIQSLNTLIESVKRDGCYYYCTPALQFEWTSCFPTSDQDYVFDTKCGNSSGALYFELHMVTCAKAMLLFRCARILKLLCTEPRVDQSTFEVEFPKNSANMVTLLTSAYKLLEYARVSVLPYLRTPLPNLPECNDHVLCDLQTFIQSYTFEYLAVQASIVRGGTGDQRTKRAGNMLKYYFKAMYKLDCCLLTTYCKHTFGALLCYYQYMMYVCMCEYYEYKVITKEDEGELYTPKYYSDRLLDQPAIALAIASLKQARTYTGTDNSSLINKNLDRKIVNLVSLNDCTYNQPVDLELPSIYYHPLIRNLISK
jgi:hypothetical protein